MTRYRKKPVEVEAWQVGSDEPMPDWVKNAIDAGYKPAHWQGDNAYYVLEGTSFAILSAAMFEQTYEVVSGREAGLAIQDIISRIVEDVAE